MSILKCWKSAILSKSIHSIQWKLTFGVVRQSLNDTSLALWNVPTGAIVLSPRSFFLWGHLTSLFSKMQVRIVMMMMFFCLKTNGHFKFFITQKFINFLDFTGILDLLNWKQLTRFYIFFLYSLVLKYSELTNWHIIQIPVILILHEFFHFKILQLHQIYNWIFWIFQKYNLMKW